MRIAEIRSAIADAARPVVLPDGIPALTATGYTPDSVTEPHFFVAEYDMEYDFTHGPHDSIEFTARVLVGRADDKAAQRVLDALLSRTGPASLKTRIEAARGAPGQYALDGLADDLRVVRVQGVRWFEHAGATYVGADMVIRVIGSGDPEWGEEP